ncbi:glycosyltransferase [Solwaraspora sp. WMMB335]|uniref:glycosyltransferase n=1 Tax=Solwaraspora sp. WMMB335 TaxID=3404118 RepID=UPI003B93F79C
MRIRIDASAIVPERSAGVESFAYGLVSGLAAGADEVEVIVVAGTAERWRQRTGPAPVRWREVQQPFTAIRQSGGLRRWVPGWVSSSAPARRAVAALRQRANPVPTDDAVTIYPFHRVPVRAARSVLVLHDLRVFQDEFRSAADQALIRRNVARAAAVVVSWPHPYQQVRELFGQARGRTALIPLPAFHPRPAGLPARSEPGLLLYPSATARHKNHRTLLAAVAQLPEVRLVCPGPLVDPQATQLRRRAAEPDLAGRVSFTGFVSEGELTALFSRADAVVVPSLWEAASGAIFEAFSWGLPVACADVAPLRAQVEFAGGDVCFFDPHSPRSIRDAIRRLRRERRRYAEASALAGHRLAGRTWADTAADYAAVCRWVADGCRGPIPGSGHAAPADLAGGGR